MKYHEKYSHYLAKIMVTVMILVSSTIISQNLLNNPQKIVIDDQNNRLLVSNYWTGDIVQIDSAGVQSYFVKSANFIDGLEIFENVVYGIGDGRQIRAYNLDSADLEFSITLPGSRNNYLSSVCTDSSDHLFISCPMLNTIYKMRISDQTYWIFVEGNGLNGPNGMLLEKENNRLLIVNEVLDNSEPTSVMAINLADSTVSNAATLSLPRPDGIAKDKNGFYYIGGYYLPALYRMSPDLSGSPEIAFYGLNMVYPTYNPINHSILVTYFNTNNWGEFKLGDLHIENEINSQKRVTIYQNYPNPFNPTTDIEYSLNIDSPVSIAIRDVNGKVVRTLLEGVQTAGMNFISWDGKNDNGFKVSGGAYYCTIKTINYSDSIKMTLLK